MTSILKLISVLAILAGPSTAPAFAGKSEIYTGFASDLAVSGYDAVAYFEKGEPSKGSKSIATNYKGATWRFENQANLDLFLSAPETYAPQYGGYCAWAVAEGYTAKGNPKYWTIHDGKLYLNYSKKVQADWLEDIPGFIAKADENWPGVLD